MILTYNNINIYRTYMAARQRFIPFPGKNYFIQDLYSHNSAPDLMLSSFSSLWGCTVFYYLQGICSLELAA